MLQIPAASVLDHMLLRLFLLFLQQVLVQLQVPDSADASLWVEHWHTQLLLQQSLVKRLHLEVLQVPHLRPLYFFLLLLLLMLERINVRGYVAIYAFEDVVQSVL